MEVLAAEGQIEQAKAVLVKGMLNDLSWDSYTAALIQILKIERGHRDNVDSLEREPEEDHLNLDVFNFYLDFVEHRLTHVAASISS